MREKSRVLFLALLLIMLAARPVQAARHARATGELGVKSAIAMDFATGRILYEQNAEQQIPPASLTKVLTMYLTFEAMQQGKLTFTDTVPVTAEASMAGGSRMNLKPGERVIVRELMKGMAVASGNDACIAMAQYLSGGESWQPFVTAMNAKAHELGMTETVFKNPNGMPADGQVTSARDMLRLAASYLRRFPQALTFHSMTTYVHNNHNHHNANRLLTSYEGVDGLKTGFVQASGYNNIVTAKRGETRVIAVVLGARNAGARAAATRKLLDLAFARVPQGPYLGVLDEQRGRGMLPPSLAHVTPRPDQPEVKGVREVPEVHAREVAAADEPTPAAPVGERGEAKILMQPKSGKFAIQESSFQSRRKAERRAQHLERRGLPVKVVATNLGEKGKWYRVLVGPYASVDAAKKTREKILGRGATSDE